MAIPASNKGCRGNLSVARRETVDRPGADAGIRSFHVHLNDHGYSDNVRLLDYLSHVSS